MQEEEGQSSTNTESHDSVVPSSEGDQQPLKGNHPLSEQESDQLQEEQATVENNQLPKSGHQLPKSYHQLPKSGHQPTINHEVQSDGDSSIQEVGVAESGHQVTPQSEQ